MMMNKRKISSFFTQKRTEKKICLESAPSGGTTSSSSSPSSSSSSLPTTADTASLPSPPVSTFPMSPLPSTCSSLKLSHHSLTPHSWLKRGVLPTHLSHTFISFTELWQLHPQEFGEVKIMGKLIKTPRWQQTYGRNYSFSGLSHSALPVPPQLQAYLDWGNSLNLGGVFNQILVNWYGDGHHYIGKHSDDERELVRSNKTSNNKHLSFSHLTPKHLLLAT